MKMKMQLDDQTHGLVVENVHVAKQACMTFRRFGFSSPALLEPVCTAEKTTVATFSSVCQ